MPLSPTAVKNAKPANRPYKMTDGEGMFLLVTPSGSKLWRLAYRFKGKQKTLAIGAYPAIDLPKARAARAAARELLAEGVDPSAHKQAEGLAFARAAAGIEAPAGDSFEEIARRWYAGQERGWSPGHASRILARIEADVFPEIGKMPVNKVTPQTVLEMLRKVEGRGAFDTTRRLKQYVSAIFRFAAAEGKVASDPASLVGDALQKVPRTQHRAKLSADDLPDFFAKLDAYDGDEQTALAVEFVVYCFPRTTELIKAPWSEFENLDKPGQALWRIPEGRMKMVREHLIPLAPRPVAILRRLKEIAGDSPFVLPSKLGGTISNNTMLYALYRMGYHSRATMHGFRGTASTILNEREFNRDWIEMQLAHEEGNDVRAAYNSALYLRQRREMMNWYATFLDEKKALGRLLS